MRHTRAAPAAALLFLLGLPAPAEEPLPLGTLVPRVVCAGAPEESYALYLPSAYVPTKRWPLLYLYDARKRGELAAKRFVPAAEEYGWILVSSNNSMSDGPLEPNIAAMKAMLADTHARFAVDDRRLYASGFSGGARVSALMGYVTRTSLAGVIGCGAAFPDPRPRQGTPFVHFGTVGIRDFNYYEMKNLQKDLAALGVPHRLAVFDGGHEWAPPEVCMEAVEWLELSAMRRSLREKDEALAARLLKKDLDAARALEAKGESLAALRRYEDIVRDGDALGEPVEAKAKVAELLARKDVKKQWKEDEARDADDERLLRDLHTKLAAALLDAASAPASRVTDDLQVRRLKERARSAKDPADRVSAERILSNLLGQTSFYLPTDFREKGQPLRAALCLQVASEIEPDSATILYNLACARAQAGQKKEALDALQRAVDKGFRQTATMESDPDLAPLHGEARYRDMLEGLRKGAS